LYTGTKVDSDVTIVENDSESKGNDNDWDKEYSPSSDDDCNNKNNGVCMPDFLFVHELQLSG
jgi:hypothetical protein